MYVISVKNNIDDFGLLIFLYIANFRVLTLKDQGKKNTVSSFKAQKIFGWDKKEVDFHYFNFLCFRFRTESEKLPKKQ